MATPTEFIKLTGTILRSTDKAIHFTVDKVGDTALEESVTHWFPFSQISSQTSSYTDGQDEIKVAAWIVKNKELI